uniref:Uncharacterized protein n=1 Tax=viral metagenome TaxID=1070528 RepID=A0A6C0LRT0_9ZZZZ
MYVNQIDDIIDKILDRLYLEGLIKDSTFNLIISENKLNYVEYCDQINKFIKLFMEDIDTTEIYKLINNRENLQRILDIIKRYIAYYYFLSIAYHYTGNIKDYRNNLIQYSKLQEKSSSTIKNFFDTENNSQLIKFYKIIKDSIKILLMSDLQKKTLNLVEVKEAISFLNELGTDYIDNYFLYINRDKQNEETVQINVHNLIKTIVFRNIYRNQEQNIVFGILNEIEEEENEYTYIDIIITGDELSDFDSFRKIFVDIDEDKLESIAREVFDLINESSKILQNISTESKNNSLLQMKIITPIVDDFLRYHRDSERIETEMDKPLISQNSVNNNAKNIQLALLYQQRKKKENTKAQLIVNKLDVITDFYSENVKKNPELKKEIITKYFHGPLSYRKVTLHNYSEEVRIMTKIINQGRRVMESNEYYLELRQINNNAYFNFKDLQKYGTILNIESEYPINVLRYSNIEFKNQFSNQEIETYTRNDENTIHLVGLSLGPFGVIPLQCITKENLINIRELTFAYITDKGKTKKVNMKNGFKFFLRLIKYIYVENIDIIEDSEKIRIIHKFDEVIKNNPNIVNKIIYWIYDIENDQYNMETYEDIDTTKIQDNIAYMNAIIYEKMTQMFHKKLTKLINQHTNLSIKKILFLIESYNSLYDLSLRQDEKRKFFIEQYLRKKQIDKSKIISVEEIDRIVQPEINIIPNEEIYRIRINTTNPISLNEYIQIEAYAKKSDNEKKTIGDNKCQHEIEWTEIMKLKMGNINHYNSSLTQFIEKYALETYELDFVCKICGHVLPMKQYIQDGSFDNNSQRFVTAYLPVDISLGDMKEYKKYSLTIRYLDGLINKISLITGTNMLIGQELAIKQARKAIVKNIIDIISKHNQINIHKNMDSNERSDYYAKKFNINKDLSGIFFFELDDKIFDFNSNVNNTTTTELNRLKFNNILLYFMYIFITELNGSQISMIQYDKIANIYIYLQYGSKLFDNLMIKKNVNDKDVISIEKYPVLCYLIFIISYFLIKYKLWYYPVNNSHKINMVIVKIIINSFVELFNSIALDAGKMENDYIYLLTTSKMYTQLNNVFQNLDIINVLKRNQIKYSGKTIVEQEKTKHVEKINPIKEKDTACKIATYKLSSGIIFDFKDDVIYPIFININDITNCETGDFHNWINKGANIICTKCSKNGEQITGEHDSVIDNYYFNLNKIANRRCLDGNLHDFVGREDEFICTKCHHKMGEAYTKEDLNNFEKTLDKIGDINNKEILEKYDKQDLLLKIEQDKQDQMIIDLVNEYQKNGEKIMDTFINQLEDLIGEKKDLGISKYPVYLRYDVYIITHAYDGTLFQQPYILTEQDNKIIFKENHSFFKTDVYYYSDNRSGQIDIFYHAVTLQLLGYKDKHKDYISLKKSNNFLQISPSILNRFLMLGFTSKYIDVNKMINNEQSKNINNYYQVMNDIIRNRINVIKSIIDKISSLIFKIKNYQPSDTSVTGISLQSTLDVNNLVAKNAKLIQKFELDKNIFSDWNKIRGNFTYTIVNWKETNFKIPDNNFINYDLINYYDTSSKIATYYLIKQLIEIIEANKDKTIKINISLMYIDIINYIYNLYNTDTNINIVELKRFNYILDGSDVMVDLLKKGQGLNKMRELEEQIDKGMQELDEIEEMTEEEREEVEDLNEEAESLDVESSYYEDEGVDYVESGEYES